MTNDQYIAAKSLQGQMESLEGQIEHIKDFGLGARWKLSTPAYKAVTASVLGDLFEQLGAAKKAFEEL